MANRRNSTTHKGTSPSNDAISPTSACFTTNPTRASHSPYEGDFTLTFDFVAGTVKNSGLVGHVIVPGQGVINLTAGVFLARTGLRRSARPKRRLDATLRRPRLTQKRRTDSEDGAAARTRPPLPERHVTVEGWDGPLG